MTRQTSIRWLKAITYVGIYGGLLMPLVFVPVVIFPFVFSKLLFLQMLIGITFPAYLILAIVEPQYRPKWVPLYVAIAAYFFALSLSVLFSVDPLRAWWGNQERMNGLFTILHFFAWLTMAVSILKTWNQWKKLLLFEVSLSMFMAIVALLQKPYPRLLAFPAGARVGGLLDNPIYMAVYQMFNLFFILLLWFRGVSRATKYWLVLFALFDIAAFLAAQSRGALVGLAFGILVFSFAFVLMTPSKKVKLSVLGITALLFLSYGGLFALRNTDAIQHSPLARLTNFQVASRTRIIAWEIAWKGFLERPLTGWGLDDFHILFNEKYNPESLEHNYYETWFDRAHNTVMDALAMTGIFGTITFFGIFGTLFYSVLRAYRRRWIDVPTASIFFALPVGYFIQNLFVFDQPAGFTMSFLLYGLIIRATGSPEFDGTNASVEERQKPEHRAPRAIPWFAFGILELLAVVVIWRTSVLPAVASYHTIKSNNYFSAGLYAEAFELAKKAARIQTPYLDEQTFLQSRNLVTLLDNGTYEKYPFWKEWHQLVKDVSTRHLSEHPRNTHPHFMYARFLDSFSRLFPEDVRLVEEQYREAIKTSPKRQQLYYNLGRFYLQQGRKQEAYELFRQAVDFDPNVGESHWYLGLTLLLDLNQREAGAKELAAAVQSSAPYSLQFVRNAAIVASAFEILNDTKGFLALLQKLPQLSGGDVPTYLEFARIAERMGLLRERDLLLQAIVKADPTVSPRFAPLLVGHSATSINDSLKQTESLVAPKPTAARSPSTAPAAAITSTSTGMPSGPRLRK